MQNYLISKLFIYPIKGLGGISLQSSHVFETGLKYDRQWMLIDAETKRFISQRSHPIMSLFNTSIVDENLVVHFKNQSINIPINLYDEKMSFIASVWDDMMQCNEVGQEISLWFSNHLDTEVKLVKMTGIRNHEFTIPPFNAAVGFADAYPILILGTASLDLLNSRCPEYMEINRFRPNIVVQTYEAHEEDNWSNIDITNSEVKLKVIKPCVRCQVIMIDQSTSISSKEPTKTLAEYRRIDKGIIFGANTICLNSGEISLGDTLIF